ncbi:hypothetical protein ACFX5U_20520 [Sphingobacterium sp. SG20118]|uniref:hypothetical protein n=1 Tax=Sphingobacterium sp. SG20118 TaxID=3367156 RepID=UPI0037DFBFFF
MKSVLLITVQTLFTLSLFAQKAPITIETDSKELAEAFDWAKEKARSFVLTGKSGPVNIYKKDQASETVDYLPSYWAGYPLRTAFYSRDFCHQAIGAHLLGLEEENFTMLQAFAKSATKSRKWYPLWAINFDGSPYLLDYKSDQNFVREIPAVFELVETNFDLYNWTKDTRYLNDASLWTYNQMAVSEFVTLHDVAKVNGVADADGAGNIFQGTSTYNEHMDQTLIESGDGIGSQYRAYRSFSEIARLKNDQSLAKEYTKKAQDLWTYFNTDWGIRDNAELYNRGYDTKRDPVSGWGKENSWFMPLKGITDLNSTRHQHYLNFIDEQLSSPQGLPKNIEAITYVPEVFFKYGQDETGWKWLKYIISKINTVHAVETLTGTNGNYPEVSFVLISNIVQDLTGIQPGQGAVSIETCSHLPQEIGSVKIHNVPIGEALYEVEQKGTQQSTLRYSGSTQPQQWRAGFPGKHAYLYVNGKKKKSQIGLKNGFTYSYVDLKLVPTTSYVVTTSAK